MEPAAKLCKVCGIKPAGSKKSRCRQCDYQHEKQAYPYQTALRELRNNAKRRKIICTLTLEEFTAFAYPVDLLVGRGRTATSLHVDRIIEELGYVAGNLQVLTCSQNSIKENERRRKQKTYDVELATRRRLNAYGSQEEAAEDENRPVFRYAPAAGDQPANTPTEPDEDLPF